MADDLGQSLERLGKAQRVTGSEGRPSVRSSNHGVQPSLVTDRLTEDDVRTLVERFHSGTPKTKLAARYGISRSSVTRLIREARSSDDSPEA